MLFRFFNLYLFDTRDFKWLVPHWESFRIGCHIMVPVLHMGPYLIARRRKP